MARIKLLDEDTVNKIAAGEVIERPASAVKELMENSIDAGATRIVVEVEDGGKSLIRVTDDGCGMLPDDLPLAFQKHATSKIRDARDLDNIMTLGFRGEALSSIASVSRSVEVRTRTRESVAGTYLRIDNGRLSEVKEVGCPEGTVVVVWDLFFNVPARRKHLKRGEAELVYVANSITEAAIINWGVSFDLYSGKRHIFKSFKSSSWDDVLLSVFDLKTLKAMSPLRAEGPGWHLSGVVGDPFSTRSSPDRIFLFVNGRPVNSRALTGALREAYRNIIPHGRSPIAVLSLQIVPQLVDVNVHPAKREIRLLKEEDVCSELTRAASEALQSCDRKGCVPPSLAPQKGAAGLPASVLPRQRTLPLEICKDPEGAVAETASGKPAERLRILGQILDLYIVAEVVAEGEDGLMLIDQHAAAERIRFERLCERYSDKKIHQELAEPIALDLSASEMVMLESWRERLADIGFDIAPFGGNTISVRSVPALGRRLEDPRAIYDLLRDLFSRGRASSDSTSRDDILKLLACKGSIKSGRGLTLGEMQKLLNELGQCHSPDTCPHGRPVMIKLDRGYLERLFARR